jgi:hypothetical protein
MLIVLLLVSYLVSGQTKQWAPPVKQTQSKAEASSLRQKQVRYKDKVSEKESEKGVWFYKISEEESLENFNLQLVTSKYSDDFVNYIGVQVFDNVTKQLVQELDLSNPDYQGQCAYCIEKGDYNFDGMDDFSLFERTDDEGVNTTRFYFLYDPVNKQFFDSGFIGISLTFNNSDKTIHERKQYDGGKNINTAVYKVENNQMVIVEKHCFELNTENKDGKTIKEYLEINCLTNDENMKVEKKPLSPPEAEEF